MAHFEVGVDYPALIIDATLTARAARIQLHQPRQSEIGQAEKARILSRHSLPATDRPKGKKRKVAKK